MNLATDLPLFVAAVTNALVVVLLIGALSVGVLLWVGGRR